MSLLIESVYQTAKLIYREFNLFIRDLLAILLNALNNSNNKLYLKGKGIDIQHLFY